MAGSDSVQEAAVIACVRAEVGVERSANRKARAGGSNAGKGKYSSWFPRLGQMDEWIDGPAGFHLARELYVRHDCLGHRWNIMG
jgi:hypothetical protein